MTNTQLAIVQAFFFDARNSPNPLIGLRQDFFLAILSIELQTKH